MISADLFKSLRDGVIKVLHSLCQQIWKTQQWPQDWKRSILMPIPKRDSTKECANHWAITFLSYANSEVAQSCPTLSDPMDCSLPGSSIHGIFQARVLEWGATAFSAHASKARLKILHAVLEHYANQELPDV